jgi:hypothetical protein
MKNKSQQLDWLEKEIRKDEMFVETEKNKLIQQIKQLKKEELLPEKPKKLTIWQRIKKVLMG